MEPGIIHDDDFSRLKRWGEALAYILSEDVGVAVSLKAERRLQLVSAQRGNHRGASGEVARFLAVKPRTAFPPAARQPVAVVDAAFVHIDQPVLGNISDRFPPQAAGEFIALGVQQRFFYEQYSAAASPCIAQRH